MGRDKALLVVDGESLAARCERVLTSVCEPCVEVGPGHTSLFSLREVPPGSGPLAATVAGWRALQYEFGHHGPVIVLAVDMPRVDEALLRFLAEAPGDESVVPEAGGRLQPLCARYSSAALSRCEELVQEGERSMHALIDRISYRRLAEDSWGVAAAPDALVDLDTPTDLERWS